MSPSPRSLGASTSIAEGLANDALLADSALSQARQRLGKQPLEWLFKQCADVWGRERYPDHWHGLHRLARFYGSILPSMGPEPRICLNSEHISARVTPTNRQTPNAAVGHAHECPARWPTRPSARTARGNPLASEFIHSLPDKSVTLLDKGFFGADLLLRIQAEDTDRHWLIPERKGWYTRNLSAMATVTVCCK